MGFVEFKEQDKEKYKIFIANSAVAVFCRPGSGASGKKIWGTKWPGRL